MGRLCCTIRSDCFRTFRALVSFPARTDIQTTQTAAQGIPGLIRLNGGIRTIKASDTDKAQGRGDLSSPYSQPSVRAWLIRTPLGHRQGNFDGHLRISHFASLRLWRRGWWNEEQGKMFFLWNCIDPDTQWCKFLRSPVSSLTPLSDSENLFIPPVVHTLFLYTLTFINLKFKKSFESCSLFIHLEAFTEQWNSHSIREF